jgi:rhodanese-related sulfurtransferase/DNA-binding transcriptional ArsR family regulator
MYSIYQLNDDMRQETVSSRSAAGAVRAALAEVAKALGHEHRIELVEQLAQGPRSVEALAERVGLSVANASQHLQQLRRAGMVNTQRDGKRVVYRLADRSEADIVALLGGLRHVAEHTVAAMERVIRAYFRERDQLEPVAASELVRRLCEGSVVLIDVRPEDEYELGHLPGALNIPLSQLVQRLSELPRDHEIVAYCRGPYCVLSFEAVAELRAHGFNVRRFDEGFPEWKAAGLPIETAA